MEVSLYWLSNGFKLPNPQRDPEQCHSRGNLTSGRGELHCACSKGTFSPPSPTAVQPPSPCRSLFVLNVSLLVREKQKIPQNSCLHPLSRKMGQFTAAIVRRISCLGVWKLPRVESSRQPARPLLSLAQITTKTATATATTTTKHATWAPAHTNTPTEPNRRDKGRGFREEFVGRAFRREAHPLARSHGSPTPSPPTICQRR